MPGDTIDEEGNIDSQRPRRSPRVSVNLSVLGGGAIEHAELTGKANINATGNASANQLAGNDGANMLDGLRRRGLHGRRARQRHLRRRRGRRPGDRSDDGQQAASIHPIDRSPSIFSLTSLCEFEHVELTGSAGIDATGNEVPTSYRQCRRQPAGRPQRQGQADRRHSAMTHTCSTTPETSSTKRSPIRRTAASIRSKPPSPSASPNTPTSTI